MASDVYKVAELALQIDDVIRRISHPILGDADVFNHQTGSLGSCRCNDGIEPLSDFPKDPCRFRIPAKLGGLMKTERGGIVEPLLLHLHQFIILGGAKLHEERPRILAY